MLTYLFPSMLPRVDRPALSTGSQAVSRTFHQLCSYDRSLSVRACGFLAFDRSIDGSLSRIHPMTTGLQAVAAVLKRTPKPFHFAPGFLASSWNRYITKECTLRDSCSTMHFCRVLQTTHVQSLIRHRPPMASKMPRNTRLQAQFITTALRPHAMRYPRMRLNPRWRVTT